MKGARAGPLAGDGRGRSVNVQEEMLMKRLGVVTMCFLGLAGCASAPGIHGPKELIIDRQFVDQSQYAIDLAECQRYAEQVPMAEQVTQGTVAGAAVGGAVGAVVGDSDTAKRSAGAGAVLGGVESYQRANREKHQVLRRCMEGRGYRVLN
tara:strand:+ start:560 stop:1012 length:453 start_codon:yes stop_codon:yes gene_type:complete